VILLGESELDPDVDPIPNGLVIPTQRSAYLLVGVTSTTKLFGLRNIVIVQLTGFTPPLRIKLPFRMIAIGAARSLRPQNINILREGGSIPQLSSFGLFLFVTGTTAT
jgi:hypothetical protein